MIVWRIAITAMMLAAIQLATFTGYFFSAVTLITLLAAGYGIFSIVSGQMQHSVIWAMITVVGVLSLIASTFWAFPDGIRIVAQAPTVAIYVVMLVAFGRTLSPDTEPIITRFRRLDGMPLTEPMVQYTRRLTWIWTLLFGLAAVLTAAAVLTSEGAQGALVFSFGLMPLVMLVLFVAEHVYRAVHYGPSEWASPLRTARLFFKADAWSPS